MSSKVLEFGQLQFGALRQKAKNHVQDRSTFYVNMSLAILILDGNKYFFLIAEFSQENEQNSSLIHWKANTINQTAIKQHQKLPPTKQKTPFKKILTRKEVNLQQFQRKQLVTLDNRDHFQQKEAKYLRRKQNFKQSFLVSRNLQPIQLEGENISWLISTKTQLKILFKLSQIKNSAAR
eukprot:TRINITY_DN6528_c0_g2_i2.p2 TRINITY_DN6528_c0_g2~~TRINITY_DN6528_c0_g2_i2.p2  ORF type:complete len:179 (+),score=11.63 TRINITY_DN6528_c0_g2_i2:969-1505(+)